MNKRTKPKDVREFLPYQKECIQSCMDNPFGRVVLPTGSGKTVIAQEVIRLVSSESKTPTSHLVFVPRIMLAKQWIRKMASYLINQHKTKITFININSGNLSSVIQNEIEQALFEVVGNGVANVVSTTNTQDYLDQLNRLKGLGYHVIAICTYHSNEVLLNAGTVFNSIWYDESHYLANDNGFFSATKINADRKYYLTATPRYTDSDSGLGMNNEATYGPVICEKSPKEIIDAGSIVRPFMHAVGIPPGLDKILNSTDDEVINPAAYNALFDMVTSSFARHRERVESNSSDPDKIGAKMMVVCNGQKTLEGVLSSKHFRNFRLLNPAIKIFALSSEYGIYLNGVHTNSPVTNELKEKLLMELDRMGDNEECIIFHVDMIAEGLDVPGMTGVMFLRNVGKIKFLQNTGRATRLHNDDRLRLENKTLKVGKYKDYIKPQCYVILPYCMENKDDFIERNINIIVSMRSDYGFDPSEHIIVDLINPAQVGPEFEEDDLKREIRGAVADGISEFYHQIEEKEVSEEEFLAVSHFRRLCVDGNTDLIKAMSPPRNWIIGPHGRWMPKQSITA